MPDWTDIASTVPSGEFFIFEDIVIKFKTSTIIYINNTSSKFYQIGPRGGMSLKTAIFWIFHRILKTLKILICTNINILSKFQSDESIYAGVIQVICIRYNEVLPALVDDNVHVVLISCGCVWEKAMVGRITYGEFVVWNYKGSYSLYRIIIIGLTSVFKPS